MATLNGPSHFAAGFFIDAELQTAGREQQGLWQTRLRAIFDVDARTTDQRTLGTLADDTVPPFSTLATDLDAEAISLRVRWFGIVLGLVIVNGPVALETFGSGGGSETSWIALNAILFLGAMFALLDTIWSGRGRVFLGDVPLFVSLMEAVFIGLLCYFEHGANSAFRVYYFLSLLIAAVRYQPTITWSTLALHSISYTAVAFLRPEESAWWAVSFTVVLMSWVTWASTALARLIQSRNQQLQHLNAELIENQHLLEDRIAERTRELQESQAHLVQQEKQAAFGLLAAGIAHEVGNPLAAISSLVQMLNRRDLDDYTHQRLGMIDEQLTRIQGTLKELVDFSRPASTIRHLIDIREACEAALSIAKYYQRRKGKHIETDYGDLPGVETVRDQLVQVVLNLVLNAMDATEEGSTIRVRTFVESAEFDSSDGPGGVNCERFAVIEVVDSGVGIPESTQAKVFRPYVTTKSHGTGLGLFVCRNLVEQSLEGRLTLERSQPGETVFAIRLPVESGEG